MSLGSLSANRDHRRPAPSSVPQPNQLGGQTRQQLVTIRIGKPLEVLAQAVQFAGGLLPSWATTSLARLSRSSTLSPSSLRAWSSNWCARLNCFWLPMRLAWAHQIVTRLGNRDRALSSSVPSLRASCLGPRTTRPEEAAARRIQARPCRPHRSRSWPRPITLGRRPPQVPRDQLLRQRRVEP